MSQHNKNTVTISLTSPQKKEPKSEPSLSLFPNDTHSESENLSDITEDFGQLFVKVISCCNFDVETGFLGAYAILTLEKQQHRTATLESTIINRKNTVEWHQEFNFDVTQAEAELTISVWGKYPKNKVVSFGKVSISSKVLRDEKRGIQTMSLPLRKMTDSARLLKTEITISVNFTKMTKKSVGPNDFEYLAVIGRGSFGKVFQVRKKDSGCIYAMKVIKKENVIKRNAVKHTMAENRILKSLQHPFLVNLKYAFQTKERLYMVIDYLNGGELFYHLTQDDIFSEERARFYAAEVVLALGYLHDNGILYRDLKPENLLLDMHGHICLVDFGLCKEGLGIWTKTHTFCGSPEYIAPEVLRGEGYGKEIDWWALGTLIYEMLTGLPPFWSEDEELMRTKILKAPLHLPPELSPEVKDLLKKLLDRNPEKRLGSGVDGTEQVKSHPWFTSIDWRKCYLKELEPPFKPHVTSQLDLNYFDEEFTRENPRFSFTNPIDEDIFLGFSYDGRPELKALELRQSKSRISIAHERRRRFSSHSSSSSTGSFITLIKKENDDKNALNAQTSSPEITKLDTALLPTYPTESPLGTAETKTPSFDNRIKITQKITPNITNNNNVDRTTKLTEISTKNDNTQIVLSEKNKVLSGQLSVEYGHNISTTNRSNTKETTNQPKSFLTPILEQSNENVSVNNTNQTKRDSSESKTPRSGNVTNSHQSEKDIKKQPVITTTNNQTESELIKPRISNPNTARPGEHESVKPRTSDPNTRNQSEPESVKSRTSDPNTRNQSEPEAVKPRTSNPNIRNQNEPDPTKPRISNPNTTHQNENPLKIAQNPHLKNVNITTTASNNIFNNTNIKSETEDKTDLLFDENDLKKPRIFVPATTNINKNNNNFRFVQVKPNTSEPRKFLIGNKKVTITNTNTNTNRNNTNNTNVSNTNTSDFDLDSEFDLPPTNSHDSQLIFPLD